MDGKWEILEIRC